MAASPASPILNGYRKAKAPIENEESASLTIGVAYAYQPASSAHGRGHDRPAYRREHPEELHPVRQEPRPLYRQASGDSDSGRAATRTIQYTAGNTKCWLASPVKSNIAVKH